MRRLTARETGLAALVAVVVLLAATVRWMRPRVEEWRAARRARTAALAQQREYRRLAAARPEFEARLAELRRQLPVYPAGRDITAELLRALERSAEEHGVVLLRRDASRERVAEDLREQSIVCQWEAELPALVRLLFALQTGPGLLDVSPLTCAPAQAGGGRLRGTFTVEYAYIRGAAESTTAGPGKT